jgi:hypothetical protein
MQRNPLLRSAQLAVVLTLLAATFSTARLASAAPRDSERKIRTALKKKVVCDFEKIPLAEAVGYLKNFVGVEIQLDLKALGDAGVESDTPITFRVKDVSLKSALNLMLRPLDLTYVYKDEVLLITTPEQVEQYLKVKVYDVRDLLR